MKKRFYLLLIILLVIIDELSKFIILKNFSVSQSLVIIKNFFKICYVQNTGISFGMFSGNVMLISVISILITIYMIYDLFKSKSTIHNISCSLIISGAFGNLFDRIFRGYVVDFISFTLFGKEMAIFNISDILITFGIILYIFVLFKEEKNERNSSK